ncbi:MAG: trypsin-like peptidase domain-containing protein [Deltaproteobacteria bacterium]|nr:trypsin-like peptidase domain-containing protein [Deltaproteobacteria bacterium]
MAGLALLLAVGALASEVRHTPVVEAVQAAAPWVVSIETETVSSSPFSWADSTRAGAGSGVLIGDGLVLTNAHVVDGARTVRVHTDDGRAWDGTLLGLDTSLDLAVLQVDAGATGAVKLGSSEDLLLGETVIAIGNPFGIGQSVTTGVISRVEREMELQQGVRQGYIQTDAAINPGNSGGALLNLDGELIGINTAIFTKAEGIGFAIPVDRALKVARDLARYGSVDAPWLAADLADLSSRTLRAMGLSGGVMLTRVFPQAATVLQERDVLLEVNGHALRSRADLNAQLAVLKPGVTVELALLRGGSRRTVQLPTSRVPADLPERILAGTLGVELAVQAGVVAVRVASPAGGWALEGLRQGDAIVAIDGQQVHSAEEVRQALARAKAAHRPSASFTVARGRAWGTVSLGI